MGGTGRRDSERAFKRAVRGPQRTRGTGSLGCRAKRKIRSQQKLTYQLASKAASQPVRIRRACALDLLRFDVGYRKNLRRIVQELAETIFGGALSRVQRPISSLCRNSCSAPFSSLTDMRFPLELSWSHRLLVDVGTIALLQENFELRFGLLKSAMTTDKWDRE